MGRRIQYVVADLFRLWRELELTRTEVARRLGVTENQLTKIAARHGLGPRGRRQRAFSMDDPTPDEIAARAAECRERHMAQRRAETDDASRRKACHARQVQL